MPTSPTEPITPTEPVEPPKPSAPVEVPKPTAPVESEKTQEGDLQKELDKWKAMSRKHEGESKANADKAKKFDELEESQKTEAQKLIDRAEKAEARALEIEIRATRAEVAAAKGITGEGIKFLTGTTKEELEASADALAAFKGKPIIPDTGGGARGGDITGGGEQMTQADVDKLTAEKKFDEIVTAQAAGRLNNLLGIKS